MSLKSYSQLVPYRMVTNPNYTSSYWGSQHIDNFPQLLHEAIARSTGYFDITAGGGAFLHRLAKEKNVFVGGNDRNLYAYWNLRATFQRLPISDLEDWFESFCKATHPENVSIVPGYLTSITGQSGQAKFTAETAAYIDTLLTTLDDAIIKAAVARTLVSNFTFRGLSWSKRDSGNHLVELCTPEWFWVFVCRTAWRIMHFANQLPRLSYPLTNLDAKASLEHLPIKGAVVYTDPAWPWVKEAQNPYAFFTFSIGQILQQGKIEGITFWSNKDIQVIYDEVESWIRKAFEYGATTFCLSTQSTNFPDPQGMYDYLGTRLKMTEVVELPAKSISQQKPFSEWFGFFIPE